MNEQQHETRDRVEEILAREVERVTTAARAEVVLARAEQLAANVTEDDQAQAVAADPRPAAEAVADAERGPTPAAKAAATLAETAAQTVAPTPEAEAVLEAAQAVLGPRGAVSPRAVRGRTLLRQAAIRRMRPLDRVDARLFLLVNGLPHPAALDRLANSLTVLTRGGWIWSGAILIGALLGTPRAWSTLLRLLVCVPAATFVVELPIKAVFRRRRPFIDVIRAIVVGKKPGSWSFPSGHTASSFAAAWVVSLAWPRRAPLFYALAGTVGFSRVYVGAHYPGDVSSGALAGTFLAELVRRLVWRRRQRRLVWRIARGWLP